MTYTNKKPLAKAQSTRKLKEINDLSYKIIGAAMEVHKVLGPGLLESIYQKALAHELKEFHKFEVAEELPIDVVYKNQNLNQGFRIDILVQKSVIIELKSVETILPVHKKQLLTYLRLSQHKLGLLINFNKEILREGITRVVNDL